MISVVGPNNNKLTPGQKELLNWHFKSEHWNLQWIQSLIHQKILYCKDDQASKLDSICQCAACNLSKQIQCSKETTLQELKIERDGNLKKNMLKPGGCLSTDQFVVSSVPG